MFTIAAFVELLVSFPNGVLVDRYGRKKTLLPGLLIVAASAFLLSRIGDYGSVLAVIVVYGMGEGITMGGSQAYVMDLAPEQRRGAFLGVWSLFTNSGAVIAPLVIGFVAQQYGFSASFQVVGVAVGVSAVVLAALAPETGGRASGEGAARRGLRGPAVRN
jgi:MFS family permease